LADGKKGEDAEKQYRASVDLLKKVSADFPAVTDYAIRLGGTYCNLGHVTRDRGRPNDALTWYAQAIATLSAVVEKDPRHQTARWFLGNSHRGRAETLDQLKRYDEAARDWASAMDLAPLDRKQFIHCLLMVSRANARQFEEALKDADQLARSDVGDVVYNCACVYALAHAESRNEKHAVHAVELLRQAAAKGYRDVATIKKDPDFDNLQARDDFRQLMAELEKEQALKTARNKSK
jgi:tetratricopeptide (TPR) repeat protein